MAYRVKKLAELSGVSVRTLHFYDEIALLKPAYVGEQGYRYYEEEQILLLQQILFFRELGFELKEIKRILSQGDFDKLKALETHKHGLSAKKKRMAELIQTIDKTIAKMKGEINMSDKEIYRGFSPEQQAEYESYLVNRYGDKLKGHIAEAKANTANWSEAKNEQAFIAWDEICHDLAQALARNQAPDSAAVQALIKKHYEWIKQFWTPDRQSYVGLGQGYLDLAWKQAFAKHDQHHPKLARFMAEAMRVFAERNLK